MCNNIMTIGIIYRIDCNCGCLKFYIGSTKKTLQRRMSCHKGSIKRLKSPLHKHMNDVGFDNFDIHQIDIIDYNDIAELRILENRHIIETKAIELGFNYKHEIKIICIHNRDKSDCIPCNGKNICHHNRRKRACSDCTSKECCICHKNIRKKIYDKHLVECFRLEVDRLIEEQIILDAQEDS